MMRDNNMLLLIVGGAAALAGYVVRPAIKERVIVSSPWGGVLNMRLDPDIRPVEVEDHRNRGGHEIDTGDTGADWGEARGDASPPRGGSPRRGRGGDPPPDPDGDRCWDRQRHRDVDISFCDREHRGRR